MYQSFKDPITGEWILTNPENGDIHRVKFGAKEKIKKGGIPDLVDIKITEKCDFGCRFCYTSSVKEGKECSVYDRSSVLRFYDLMQLLTDVGVYSIVLGGGEPTQHSDISSILYSARSFQTSITTRNYDMVNVKSTQAISGVDSIAYSCNSVSDVEKAVEGYEKHFLRNRRRPELYIQNIIGLSTEDQFYSFLQKCKDLKVKNITMLGFKTFGFGKDYQPKGNWSDKWLDMVKDSGMNIGMDSLAVKQWKEQLIQKGVEERFLMASEGAFSCYVDAVKGTMSPSSFCDESLTVPLTSKTTKEQFLERFAKF